MPETGPLADRIRAAIASAHDTVERTPFAVAMSSGRIDGSTYAVSLRPLLRLHEALENALSSVSDSPEIAAVFDPARMMRAPLLQADLTFWEPDGETPTRAEAAVLQLGRLFRSWAESTPWALLGALYVTEGSRMGSMILARSLAKAFEVRPEPGVGLDYHVVGIETRPADWQRFKAAVNSLRLTTSQSADILDAAVATMGGLIAVYASLPAEMPVPA